ncbi:MAG: hypothetical protein M1817_004350 [Caeruleum heppii]|nr:MAG: hypothetical protein M1817_004350 [Caeruleum heppii]
MIGGMEFVSDVITRYAIFEDLYLQQKATVARRSGQGFSIGYPLSIITPITQTCNKTFYLGPEDGSLKEKTISYFYCARNNTEPERQDSDEILRCILKQLSCSDTGVAVRQPVAIAYKKKKQEAERRACPIRKLTYTETLESITTVLNGNPATIIIDALDECDPKRRHKLLQALVRILKESISVVKVFVASRDDGDIECRLAASPNISIRATDNHEDILRYILTEVDKAITDKALLRGNVSDGLRVRVVDTLAHGANGMFLWVSLQLNNLCDPGRVKHEHDVLAELGRRLEDLDQLYAVVYSRILKSAPRSRQVATNAIAWLLSRQTLLNLRSFLAAVAVDPDGHHAFLDEAGLRDMCCNLVVRDVETDIFRFAHLSVREYFEGLPDFASGKTNGVLAARCINCYLFPYDLALPVKFEPSYRPSGLASYAILFWPLHYLEAGNHGVTVTLDEKVREFLSGNGKPTSPFHRWMSDLIILSAQRNSFGELTDTHKDAISSPPSPLLFACSFGIVSVVQELLRYDDVDWNQRNRRGASLLYLATEYGHEAIVRLLLDKKVALELVESRSGNSALIAAARSGNQTILRQLLKAGAIIDFPDQRGRTALMKALLCDHEAVMRLLITAGADLEATDNAGDTALLYAVRIGHEVMVRLLLDNGSNISAKNNSRRSPLTIAADCGYERVARLLVEKVKQLEATDNSGDTSFLKVTEQLEATDDSGNTPLLCAVSNGHEATVRLLLYAEANVNARDHLQKTPLIIATDKGNEKIVRLLLQKGANTELRDRDEQTALLKATARRRMLVLRNVSTKDKDPDGQDTESPGEESVRRVRILWEANKETVALLLEGGADLGVRDGDNRTVLYRASKIGDEATVRLLLDAGWFREAKYNSNTISPIFAAMNYEPSVVPEQVRQSDSTRLLPKPDAVPIARHEGIETQPMRALAGRHVELLRLLLDGGADIEAKNDRGSTALMHALDHEDVATAQLLLEQGADCEVADEEGDTLLLRAVRKGHSKTARFLLDAGACSDARTLMGSTLLMCAVDSPHGVVDHRTEEMVRLLLDAGNSIESRDNMGNTPLMYAVRSCRSEDGGRGEAIVRLLLGEGADATAMNVEDWTALDFAMKFYVDEVVTLLRGVLKQKGPGHATNQADEPSSTAANGRAIAEAVKADEDDDDSTEEFTDFDLCVE